MDNNRKTVLSLLAHPDDAEFMCAGTLALLKQKGWNIHIATVTPGDCGSMEHNRDETSRIRKSEATKAARIIDGTFHCLECEDAFIMYNKASLLKAIELLRKVRPAIVFAQSPDDYSVDHETASKVVRSACFMASIPNIETNGVEPLESIPYLYYLEPDQGIDIFGKKIEPDIMVDTSSVIDIKERMLLCHESQRDWLMTHDGIDEYILSMRKFAQQRGREINADYAEGFRQHLGPTYPHENILRDELGKLVYIRTFDRWMVA